MELCLHPELWFASGDYYVRCLGCHASWGKLSNDGRPEYGEIDGKKIGCAPEQAKTDSRYSLKCRAIT